MILGVSFDDPTDNKAFKVKFEFPYDLLTDTNRDASKQFGATTTDSGKASRVSVLIGPEGSVVKTYDTVKPADHPDQVLADLAAL